MEFGALHHEFFDDYLTIRASLMLRKLWLGVLKPFKREIIEVF